MQMTLSGERSLLMTTVPQLADAVQTLLTTTAETMARATGFVQRRSKLGGAAFVQALVVAWMANPRATVEARASGGGGRRGHQPAGVGAALHGAGGGLPGADAHPRGAHGHHRRAGRRAPVAAVQRGGAAG